MLERARVASGAGPRGEFTREEYERACAELELIPLSDEKCFSPEIKDRRAGPPEHTFVETVFRRLAHDRGWGILAQLREERKELRWEFERRFPRGMSRQEYEQVCVELGLQPAPDESIRAMAATYLAREEIEDLPDINLFVANRRDMGFRSERRRGDSGA
ncbi:hypothetical protein [Nonomuraea sp. NPDC050786]|uniref:hypothetical protein n=1 Tax=Nonomuraea sp. NPDC050786 TaxID=3154840 RepID=UPI0033ED8949